MMNWLKTKVELDLPNGVTKSELKKRNRCWYITTCSKTDLPNLESDIGKLDIGKLQTILVDLSKLSNIAKYDVVKKLYIMNCLKKLMLFRLTKIVIS